MPLNFAGINNFITGAAGVVTNAKESWDKISQSGNTLNTKANPALVTETKTGVGVTEVLLLVVGLLIVFGKKLFR